MCCKKACCDPTCAVRKRALTLGICLCFLQVGENDAYAGLVSEAVLALDFVVSYYDIVKTLNMAGESGGGNRVCASTAGRLLER